MLNAVCLFASYGIAFDRARFAETSLSLARELLRTGERFASPGSTARLLPHSLPLPRREPPPFGRLLAPRTTTSDTLRDAT